MTYLFTLGKTRKLDEIFNHSKIYTFDQGVGFDQVNLALLIKLMYNYECSWDYQQVFLSK